MNLSHRGDNYLDNFRRALGGYGSMDTAASGLALFAARGRYHDMAVRQIWILEWGRNPSTDYYILPRCAANPDVSYRLVDITTVDPATLEIPQGTYIVIVRYAAGSWLRRLRQQRRQLAGVAYFMDDDLPVAVGNPRLPWRYRYKILRQFWCQRRLLSSLCSEIWVSTPLLAEKYGIERDKVLPPLPLISDTPDRHGFTYFYEGTASHGAEFAWLRDVVTNVQQQTDDFTFVTVGNSAIRQIFRGIPRVLCIHPVDWPTYRVSFPGMHHDLGLAPLLESPFNRGRSPTKFFDITRYGAAGIYSNVAPYAEFIRAGQDGWLVENSPDAWCNAIVHLARSESERARIVENARLRVESARAERHMLPSIAASVGRAIDT